MGALKVLITGASGFLGQEVVRQACAAGLDVVTTSRSCGDIPCDLSKGAEPLRAELSGIDVVIHLAAAMSGSPEEMRHHTISGTENIFQEIEKAGAHPRFVLISSIAVYSAQADLAGSIIDENTRLETDPEQRDTYCQVKLQQEKVAKRYTDKLGLTLTILRPGAIYGPGRMWNAHVGIAKGPVLVRLGGDGEIPLIHVQDCAAAIIAAAQSETALTLNLVEDELPDRRKFLLPFRVFGWPKISVQISWRLVLPLVKMLRSNRGLLQPATLRARFMPVRYSNASAKAALNWVPRHRFETSASDLLAEVQHG